MALSSGKVVESVFAAFKVFLGPGKGVAVLLNRPFARGAAAALIGMSVIGGTASADLPDSIRQPRTVELFYSINVSRISKDAEDAFAWVPLPQSTPDQIAEDVRIESEWPHEVLSEEVFGNQFVRFDFSDAIGTGETAKAGKITLRVTRRARATPARNTVAGDTAEELARFLLPSKLVSIEGAVADEADRIVGDEVDPLIRARLLYDNIVDTVAYGKSGDGWGRGDSQFACDVRTGNCTDFHSLFMGEARHLGIPTRFVMGFGLPDKRGEGTIGGYHCWAEFYVDGYGWISIDASEAHRSPLKRDLLFGGLDTSRVQFTKGRDIHLPKAQGAPVNFSIYPYVEVDGKPHPNVEFTVTFKDVE